MVPRNILQRIVNGHWETIKRISHITGWLAAAAFFGANVCGVYHAGNSDIHETATEKNERYVKPVLDALHSHSDAPAHREAMEWRKQTIDWRENDRVFNQEVLRRLTEIEKNVTK